MAISYDISDKIKSAFATRLIAEFDPTRVSGISERPIITKTITNNTPEPYIYIQSIGSNETWVTKDSESRLYNLVLQIVVKHNPNKGTHVIREEISNEVLRILATDTDSYPDLSSDGFIIQNIVSGAIAKSDEIEKGARYFIANIPMDVTAALDEESAGDEDPVQAVSKTYADFQFNPSSNRIEYYDAGEIRYAETYPSDNNGWDFTGVRYSNRGNGTLVDETLTLTADNLVVEVDVDIDYELESDNTRLTSIHHTDTHNRIVSFRHGTIIGVGDSNTRPSFVDDSSDGYGLRNFNNWTGAKRSLDFGRTNPNGHEITFEGAAGEYMYLITDKDTSDITNLEHVTIVVNNIISQFESPQTIGEYKVYISTDPLAFSGDITVTVRT